MTKKYIIEYVGGTKGDMLCRFLNKHADAIEKSRGNLTKPADIGCINWLKLADPNQLTFKRFQEVLTENTDKYVPAHPLWVTVEDRYVELLQKHDYQIIKLTFQPRHFLTIRIESIIKNLKAGFDLTDPTFLLDLLNAMFWQNLDINTFTLSDIGVQKNLLASKAYSIRRVWNSRAMAYRLFLTQNNDNRQIINYEDLYVNFNSDVIGGNASPWPRREGYELDDWKHLVEKSWCNYDGEGYRDWGFEIPEEISSNDYSDTIERYLEKWKK